MLIYKVIGSKSGFSELEKEVSNRLNRGWKPVGSISFNQGFCYQAMVGKVENNNNQKDKKRVQDPKHKFKKLGAVDAMRKVDELT
ncbi:MAG: hypothetical protein COA46_09880 [Porticoccaceae bacterium]|nr:MAG: hypothetical protein COA46_09880 [Porticoccaceae bacterium]